MSEEHWRRLDRHLGSTRPAYPPGGGRVGAALVLLSEAPDGELQLVYTRRRDDLANHPGQISFPGGRREAGETVQEAAVREAAEEVALDPDSITVLGRLPALWIPPSRFWLQPVVARWDRPHALHAEQGEVAEIIHVSLHTLLDRETWRVVSLSVSGRTWAWQLRDGGTPEERRLLWGATAGITVELLDVLEPGWRRGVAPADLAPEREVRPWRQPLAGRGARPPRLPHVPMRDLAAVGSGGPARAPGDAALRLTARSVAYAVRSLLGHRSRVLVLAGGGGNGKAGLEAGNLLRGEGTQVTVGSASGFDGTLPRADVVVDALVGGGLDGPLRGAALEMLHALRHQTALLVSIDVPSGLHPEHGLVGELATADVTVALDAPRPGLLRPGLAPFVGDLYLAVDAPVPLVRLVAGGEAAGWRE